VWLILGWFRVYLGLCRFGFGVYVGLVLGCFFRLGSGLVKDLCRCC
jgi:hypothetical protein